jgi:hypothetical protein
MKKMEKNDAFYLQEQLGVNELEEGRGLWALLSFIFWYG